MKLESRSLQILKNFATINPSIIFKEGVVQSTMSSTRTILAKATLKEEMPKDFAIFDLSKFIGVLSLFTDPELEFEKSRVIIKQGKQHISYTFADPEHILAPPSKPIVLQSPEVKFRLTADCLSGVMKAMSVLQSTHICISGDGNVIKVGTSKPADPTSDSYDMEVGETEHKFNFMFKTENIKILTGDYNAEISSKNIAHLKGDDVEYWIMSDSKYSSFGG